ncbi:MAG: M15 family metallopeptidase [Cellulosilyticaceae bacterium]
MINACRDLNELHPKVKELAEKLIAACEQEGIKIGVSETYRTKERQDYLYEQGRTRPGNIVTYAKGSDMRSYHQWRLAFDVYQNVKGREYDSAVLKRIGIIGMKLGLEWGGSWSGFKDTPHFQYTFGLSIQELRGGKQPPTIAPKDTVQEGYEAAIKKLVKVGVITQTENWLPDPVLKYMKILIIKLGERILQEKDYDKIIDIFAKNTTILQTDIWKKGTYTTVQAKYFIQKIVKYL